MFYFRAIANLSKLFRKASNVKRKFRLFSQCGLGFRLGTVKKGGGYSRFALTRFKPSGYGSGKSEGGEVGEERWRWA